MSLGHLASSERFNCVHLMRRHEAELYIVAQPEESSTQKVNQEGEVEWLNGFYKIGSTLPGG